MAKTDWSDYSQNNDYSFNGSAGSFTEWHKVSAFIDGLFVWVKKALWMCQATFV